MTVDNSVVEVVVEGAIVKYLEPDIDKSFVDIAVAVAVEAIVEGTVVRYYIAQEAVEDKKLMNMTEANNMSSHKKDRNNHNTNMNVENI